MKKLSIIVLFFLCPIYSFAGHFMHPKLQIDFAKKQIKEKKEPFLSAYNQIVSMADSILKEDHHAIEDFSIPGYYDDPDTHIENSKCLQQDAFGAYCCAVLYRITGKKVYAQKAVYFLNAWALTNKRYSDFDGRLVMSYSGAGLVAAAELMSDEKMWKEKDQVIFKEWVRNVYRDAANQIRRGPNNWGDWGCLASLIAASYLDDMDEIHENIAIIKKNLPSKIKADGSMPHETARGYQGIWYTYFSLAPLTAGCWIAYNATGENLLDFEQEGMSIKKALDYLYYYTNNPGDWPWYENPRKPQAHLWPANLFEAMSGFYGVNDYLGYVTGKRPIVYPVHHFAWTFPTLLPLKF